MTIVEVIVSAAPIRKISRGSDINCAIVFKHCLTRCGEFERDKWIVGKSKIGYGFAFLGIQGIGSKRSLIRVDCVVLV